MHDRSQSRCVCTAVRKAARALSRVYDTALESCQLTVVQLAILRAIEQGDADGVPLSRLAEQLVMERTALYRALKPLEESGWIAVRSAARGRARITLLTPAGRRAIKTAAIHWQRVQQMVVERFGAERWAGVQQALHDLTLVSTQLSAPQCQAVETDA